MVVKTPLTKCIILAPFTLRSGDFYRPTSGPVCFPDALAQRLVEAGKVQIVPPGEATPKDARKVVRR